MVVRHDDQRLVVNVGQVEQQIMDLGGCLPVQVARRLIGKDQVGIIAKRPRDGHALFFAAGEQLGVEMAAIG